MTTCIACREYKFNAAHHLNDGSPCARMHGHNYRLVVGVTSVTRVSGMIIPFDDLDKCVKPVIDPIDHHLMVSWANEDDLNGIDMQVFGALGVDVEYTTTEELALYFWDRIEELLPQGVQMHKLVLYETDRNFVEVQK